MKNLKLIAIVFATMSVLISCNSTDEKSQGAKKSEAEQTGDNLEAEESENLKLGAFSVSLSVKDLAVSKEFYEKFGFTVLGGSMEENYLIMKNENSLIGLFQGMFEGNVLTFNPGWDENGEDIEHFDDIREIHKHLKKEGVDTGEQVISTSTGQASMILTDPDGNVIYIDQHR